MENWLQLLLATVAVLSACRHSVNAGILSGSTLALAVLTRHDAIILFPILLVSFFRRRSLWQLAAFSLCFTLILVPWYMFAYYYYGDAAPSSLAAKSSQGASGGMMLLSWPFLRAFFSPFFSFPLALLTPFALIGIYKIIRTREAQYTPLAMLLVWSLIQVLAYYAVLRVKHYPWYDSLPTFTLCLCAAVGVEQTAGHLFPPIKRYLSGRIRTPIHWILVMGTIAALFSPLLLFIGNKVARRVRNPQGYERYLPYHDAAIWIKDNTPANHRVLTEEVGILGYYCGRYMVDAAHLVSRVPESDWPEAEVYVYCQNPDFERPSWIGERHRLVQTFTFPDSPSSEIWLRKD